MKKRILGAVGTMALAAMLVGGGTMALFTDTVSNAGNTFATGTLTIDDITQGTGASYHFDNLAPGASGTMEFTIENTGNIDAWIRVGYVVEAGDLFAGTDGIKLAFNPDQNEAVSVAAGETYTFIVDWEFPLDAGNEYQGKDGSVTVYFDAVQKDNNDAKQFK